MGKGRWKLECYILWLEGEWLFLIEIKEQFNARRIAGKNIQQIEILIITN